MDWQALTADRLFLGHEMILCNRVRDILVDVMVILMLTYLGIDSFIKDHIIRVDIDYPTTSDLLPTRTLFTRCWGSSQT